MRAICSSSITIIDMNDITSSDTAPKKPFSGMLWMDTSMTPPVLKVWKDGVWVIQSDETIGTSNLLRNTGLRKDTSGWSLSSGVTRDTSKKKGNNNSLKYHVAGLTADAWRTGQPSQIEVDAYKRYSAACEVFIPSNHGIDKGVALEVQWFDGNGTRVKTNSVAIDTNVMGRWQRVTIERLRVPSGAVKANARVWVRQNGLFYVAELMMSEGAKIGSWVAHKDDIQGEVEDTVNGAIVAQTQEEIFNKLTNNGESQGIFMDENKNFYINGEYIRGENLNIVRHSDKQSTFKVTSDGEVEINAKTLSILGTSVATSNEVQTAVKDTVILMNTMYYLSTSNTSLVGGSWSTVAPNWVNGKYMWMKNVMTLKSGKVVESNPTCIAGATGATGSTGATGTGVSNLTVEYYLSTSKTTQTGGSWVTTPPTWSVGRYLWTRNKIVYINPSSTKYTTPVCDSSWEVVNEVTFGGRNMLEKTDIDKHGLGNWRSNNGGVLSVDPSKLYAGRKTIKVIGNNGICFNKFATLARNTVYTYSMMIHSSDAITVNSSTPLHMHLSTSNNGAEHLEIIKGYSGNIPANTWTKIWIVFSTPNVVDNYYMRPFLYGIGNATVNMCQPMLEKGNKASDWSEAPEDIQANIQDVGNALNSFKNTVNGAFKDGIIEQAEAKAIEQHLKTLDVEKSDIDKEYTTVYSNTLLNGAAKTNLASAKSSYDSSHASLKSTIRTAIADGRITTSEKTSVDSAFATYNTVLGTYRQRLQEALDFISNAKANNAKNEAISSANSTLTNTIANYYTKTQTDSAIKVSSDEINLGISQTYETKAEVTNKVNNAINGIQLGGTNLFRNSGFTSGVERWESYSTSSVGVVKVNDSKSGYAVNFNSTGGGIYQRYADKAGTVQSHPQGTILTISGYFKCSSRANLSISLEGSFGKNFTPSAANTWTKFEVTGVANGSSHTVTFYGVNGNTYHLKDLKLELGNKATDWSPAPDDTELLVLNAKNEAKEYANSQISIAKDEINLGVSQTYETKSNVESKISTSKTEAINSAKSYADTKKTEAINAAKDDATNKVNSAKNELNTAIGKKANSADVYTKSETYTQAQADSAIKVAREAIELGVKNTYETKTNVESKITTAVNNVQVGGRNLMRTSYIVNRGCTTFTHDKATNTWSCVAPKGSDSWGYGFTINSNEKIAVERGKTLIVSLEVNPEVDCTWNNDVNNYYNGATSGNDHDDQSKRANSARNLKANQWTKCWFSYTAKSNVSYDLYDARSNWGIVTTSSSNPISFKIRNVKAEYGNKPTDWTPAPEDVDNSISSAKQEAINTASADATTKANNALNNAKTYANDKKTEAINSANSTLSSTIANYYTKQDTDSRIKVAKESIELNVSNNYETKSEVTNKVNNAIDGIQVGSRNWVQNSEFKSTTGWAMSGGWSVNTTEKFRNNNSMYISRSGLSNVTWSELRSNKINVKQGDKLVGSWYIKYRDCDEDSIVCFWGYKSDGSGRVDIASAHFLRGTNANWTRYVLKGTVPANVDYVQLAISHRKNGIVYASMPQVEYGNTATDWSPAPEDTKLLVSQATNESKEYTNSQIQIAKDAINLGVSQTYETKANVSSQVATSLNNAKSYADSKKTEAINTASSDATHKANNALNNAKTYANDKKNEAITSANNTLTSTIANYYTKAQTDSAIKIAKDQIDLSVQTNYETKTEVDNKINGIQIGGRNLLPNSNRTVGEASGGEFIQFADMAPIIDTHGLIEYTISFDVKSKDTSKHNRVQVYLQNGEGAKYSFYSHIEVTEQWQRKSVTVMPKLQDSNISQAMLAFYGTYNTGNIPVVKNVKIEKGSKATDYTVAPEDIDSSISSVKNEAKEYTNSQIQIAKDAINLGVSQTYETKAEVTNKVNNAVNSIQIGGTNLLTKDSLVNGNLSGADGTELNGSSWQEFYRTKKFIDVDSNSTYTIKINKPKSGDKVEKVIAYTSENEFISSHMLNSPGTSFTLPANCKKIKVVVIANSVSTPYLAEEIKIKLEKGNKATDWAPAPEDVESAIDGIQVGGRNITKGTQTFTGWSRVSTSDLNSKYGNLTVYHNKYTASSSYADLQVFNAITPEPNTEYTLSYWAKGTGTIKNFFYPNCVASGVGGQGQKITGSDGYVAFNLSSNWTRHWVTWTTKSDVSGAKNLIASRQESSNSEVWICGVKLEKGNKPTDWSPAPEDIDASITSVKNEAKEYTNSQIQIAKDAINLGVSQTYETKSNVSSQVNSTLNSAKSYADTKKTEAINTASSDAANKANNALSNAKSYADVKKTEAISSANSTLNSTIANYYTKTQTDSQIKVARESIELGVKNTYETKTEVTNKINSVQVGGRNLIKNSNFIVQATSNAFAPGRAVALVDGINLNETFLGKTVTFSYFVHCVGSRTNGPDVLGQRFGIHGSIQWKNSSTGATTTHYPFADCLGGSYKNTRVSMSYTFTPPSGYDTIAGFGFSFQAFAKPSSDNKEAWKIGQPKLEIGNKSSDWSPAPEDTEASISSAKSEVKQYTDSQIKIAKESIDLNVKNTYETKSNVENKINTAVNNVQIGGRNIFRYSGNFGTDTKGYWENNGGGLTFDTSVTYNGFNTIKTTVGTGIRGIWYKLEPNVEYTYSALIRCNEAFTGNGVVPLHYHSGTNDTNQGKISILKTDTTYPVANQWKLLSITFKLTGDANSFRPFIYWGPSTARVFNIAYLKLEKGNKASDWVPAPEDLTERIESAEAGIRINTDSITNTVKKTDYTGQNLVSMINQTADTVKISAKHIDINGVVSFSSFDKSTQDKITAIQNTASSASSTANTAQSTANSAKSVADSVNGKVAAWCHSNNTTLIDGGKIYTGSITAQQIASSAITADKLTIGRKDNLVNNFNFANDSVNSSPIGWSNIPNGVISTSGTLSQKAVRIFGNGSIKDYTEVSNKIYVSPNEKFYIEYKICRNPEANGTAQFGAFIYQSNGSIASYSSVSRKASNVTASVWHTVKGEITVPSNGAYMIPWMSVRNDCTAGFWEFSDLKLVRMTTGELIVDGSITANKLVAKTITADKLHADVLSANNIVSIINGGSTTISGNKITTGSITADKLLVKDFTNLADMWSDKGYNDVITVSSRHTTISSMRSASDISEGDAFIIELWAKTYDSTTTLPLNFMAVIEKFSGTVNYPQVAIAQAQSSREWTKYSAILKFDAGHVYDLKAFRFDLFISKDSSATSTQKWQVKQVIVRKMSNGRLIVDGSITANMITSGTFRGTNFVAGGNSNGDGYISVLGSSNDILFRANKEGLYAKNIVFGITPDFNFKTDGYYWADGYGFHGEQGFDDGTLNKWSQKANVSIGGLRLEKTGEYQMNTGIATVEAHQIVVSNANQGQSSYMTCSQVKSGGEVQAETHIRAKGEVIAEKAITSRGGVYGSSFVQTNYGTPIEIGKYIDMHQTGSNTDVDVRIEASSRQGIRIERGDNLSQYVEIGVGTTDRYFYNSTSGKYFTLKNDGRLAYDGYTVPHNWRQSFSPFIYSDSGRFNMAEGWGEAVYLGDLVWIRGRVRGSRGGHSGSIYIGGLPVSSCGGYPALEFAFFGGVTGNLGGAGFDVRSYIEGNAAHAFITYSNKDTGGWHNLQCSHVTTGNMDISFSATYRWR